MDIDIETTSMWAKYNGPLPLVVVHSMQRIELWPTKGSWYRVKHGGRDHFLFSNYGSQISIPWENWQRHDGDAPPSIDMSQPTEIARQNSHFDPYADVMPAWGMLTDEQQAAIKANDWCQVYYVKGWEDVQNPEFRSFRIYRSKPRPHTTRITIEVPLVDGQPVVPAGVTVVEDGL